ncbi:thioesterase family protein [Parasphingopyxis algicola]|uniref:thioesterase family protein n=1 Tax=Parasphingopyxis algicola TaxID=2026624 RepID=UPI0015A0B471|nr:thioesterase family protein [Parasphingopyxis algicola]QLC26137.1 thioesterase family protein [Parasphingopyxis algicola]
MPTNLQHILQSFEPVDNGHTVEIPATWMQGRTAYGGLSAALGLHAAQQSAEGLPPLRSAQIAFIGPLAGEVKITTKLLRRGRTAAFIQSDIHSEKGLGLRAIYVFMQALESEVDYAHHDAPDIGPPPADEELRSGPPEFFTYHFQYRESRHPDGEGKPRFTRWMRLAERDGIDPMVELMLMGDSLPPAAVALQSRGAPVSSINWFANILEPAPHTRDGWWLVRSESDLARHGNSSQQMGLWSTDGTAVLAGMQSVALFS